MEYVFIAVLLLFGVFVIGAAAAFLLPAPKPPRAKCPFCHIDHV